MKLFRPALVLHTVLWIEISTPFHQHAAAQKQQQELPGTIDGFNDEASLTRWQLGGGASAVIETDSRYVRTGQGSLKVTVPKQAYYVNPRLWDYRLGARSDHVAPVGGQVV